MRLFNVIWCESWDDKAGEPRGAMRDLGGPVPAAEVPGLVRTGWYQASRYGWGPGFVVVTNEEGRRVELAGLKQKG